MEVLRPQGLAVWGTGSSLWRVHALSSWQLSFGTSTQLWWRVHPIPRQPNLGLGGPGTLGCFSSVCPTPCRPPALIPSRQVVPPAQGGLQSALHPMLASKTPRTLWRFLSAAPQQAARYHLISRVGGGGPQGWGRLCWEPVPGCGLLLAEDPCHGLDRGCFEVVWCLPGFLCFTFFFPLPLMGIVFRAWSSW